MRSLKSEGISAVIVLTVPVVLAFLLPQEALTFSARAASAPPKQPFVSFLELEAAKFAKAVSAAKSPVSANTFHEYLPLRIGSLSESPFSTVGELAARARPFSRKAATLTPPAYQPSQVMAIGESSSSMTKNPSGRADDPPTFSREEMLKIK